MKARSPTKILAEKSVYSPWLICKIYKLKIQHELCISCFKLIWFDKLSIYKLFLGHRTQPINNPAPRLIVASFFLLNTDKLLQWQGFLHRLFVFTGRPAAKKYLYFDPGLNC